MNIQEDKDFVIKSIMAANELCERNDEILTRDWYRKFIYNSEAGIYATEREARMVFGSWGEAVKASIGTLEPSINDLGNHFDPDYSYVKEKAVKGYHKILVIPDIHVPFQSNKAIECMLRVAALYGPDEVVQLGDLVDFYKISRFRHASDRGVSVAKECEQATKLLERITKESGAKTCTLLEGNHDSRIHKYLCDTAPELSDLKALKLENLLGLKDIGWNFIPAHQFYAVNNVYFTHGEFVSASSISKHMSTYNETIIHGHDHRITTSMTKFLSKTIEEWSMGCMASLLVSQEYAKAANWQHGFGTVDINGNDYWIRAHHIRNGKLSWDGKVIEV